MGLNVGRELAALQAMTVKQLRLRYAEVYGETTNAANKAWLVKRILWRLQALDQGDLSERARRRAAELANDADLRLNPPRGPSVLAFDQVEAEAPTPMPAEATTLKFQPDDRLPSPGTILTRPYKGQSVQVLVLADGFEYQGQVFSSLSAVARAVTGSHCNGYLFFRLGIKEID